MVKCYIRSVVAVVSALLLVACSSTKYVPDGQYLLSSVDIETEGRYRDINTSNLKNYVHQNVNSRWFSTFKLPLGLYNLSGTDTTKWVNRALRSLGEAPVLYDTLSAQRTSNDLRQQLQNMGYLNAAVYLSARSRGKKVKLTYKLKPGEPYFIRKVRRVVADTAIARLLMETTSSASLLREGMKFDVDKLSAERKRLTSLLNDNGYFRFHKEFITYQADTAVGSRLIDLTLRLSAYPRKELPDTLHTCYWLRNVTYSSGDPNDSTLHLRSRVIRDNTYIIPGEPYSASGLQNTYNHFGRLQAVKFTNISFTHVTDSLYQFPTKARGQGGELLDCNIQLQTNKPSTISFQPEGTNTAGDLGAAASLTYQNRNLFRGSEVLSLELRGAYEAIRGLEGYSNQDYIEYSVETRMTFPRLVAPFISSRLRRLLNATSEVSLLYDMQNRPEFHRRVLSASWRYRWNSPGRHDRFLLDLLDLNYVFMPWISSTFKELYLDNATSRNAILRYNYEDLFITKIGFGYSYSNNVLAVKTNVETSGNMLNAGAHLFGTDKDSRGHYRLFNIAFAQYVKGDVDFTRQLWADRNNQLVAHVGLGVAWPYGNSSMLPFEKRYFSGGANSVRGWSVRSLGPGKYKERDGRINFINQTGDMKLDLNVELRSKLFWKLAGALFVDAGNVWTLRDYEEQPGGQFRIKDMPSQLAVSYGAGVRFNFDYFILRFDLGMKAINPAYEEDDELHYPLVHPRFSRDYAFHFAVGLPF